MMTRQFTGGLVYEDGLNFSPSGTGGWILAVGLQFAVKQGLFLRCRQGAIKQFALFHVTKTLEDFAAICNFQLGQFLQISALLMSLNYARCRLSATENMRF